MKTKPTLFKILSLDGGGTWALIQARALQHLYGFNARGHDILSQFDMVAANSAGSLVLGGLVKNMTLSDIVRLFCDPATRGKLFAPLGLDHVVERVLGAAVDIGPKYSTVRKLSGIRSLLDGVGDVPLNRLMLAGGAAMPHLLFCAFDYDRQRSTFFRSDLDSLANGQPHRDAPTLAQAIHASTNAPVNYFDQPAVFPGNQSFANVRLWDGAIGGYNNPATAAVVESLANRSRYGCSLQTIAVLSLGTGGVNLPMPGGFPASSPVLEKEAIAPCLVRDLRKLATSIISDPPDAATYVAHVMLGGAVSNTPEHPVSDGRVVRMNPLVQPLLAMGDHGKQWVLPEGITDSQFERLSVLDIDAIDQDDVDLIGLLCDAWLCDKAPNQTIRYDSQFRALIGHERFSQAKSAWMRLLHHGEP
jgi:patatin-like phospholipase/acyl hydrolase